jgi:rRNA maturation endonuclease Nob1
MAEVECTCGGKYDPTRFQFCPWCGSAVVKEAPTP